MLVRTSMEYTASPHPHQSPIPFEHCLFIAWISRDTKLEIHIQDELPTAIFQSTMWDGIYCGEDFNFYILIEFSRLLKKVKEI